MSGDSAAGIGPRRRLVQEALTNVVKHARADAVQVRVHDGTLTISAWLPHSDAKAKA